MQLWKLDEGRIACFYLSEDVLGKCLSGGGEGVFVPADRAWEQAPGRTFLIEAKCFFKKGSEEQDLKGIRF